MQPDTCGYKDECLLQTAGTWLFYLYPHTCALQVLTVVLEKAVPSVAPKFDYWRAIVPGDHEIDTHAIVTDKDSEGPQVLQPGQYDPRQLRNMGIHMAGPNT
jgi:hypothetical protein